MSDTFLEVVVPYGLKDVKLRPIAANGTVGAAVDLPVGRTLSFSEDEDFQELRGDDAVKTRRGSGPTVSWTLEEGGISLDAYVIMAGGTLVLTGLTPNRVRKYQKKVTDSKPFFQIEGQSVNDSGGDWHYLIPKARVTESIEGQMSDQEFWITSCGGTGFAGANDLAYEFVQNETTTAIA